VVSRTKRVKYFGGAMTAICELMRSYGISKSIAEREFRAALKRGYAVGSLRPSREVRPITRIADVCGRWHIDKKYVDNVGGPKPLTWNGRTGSLLKLVSAVVGRASASEVIEEMFSRRLLRKTRAGAWVPKSKVVAPSGIDTAQIRRTATMMERLLRTVAYNSELKYRGDVLLEVMAQVPRLPARDISKFKKFAKAQGLTFARTVDDWLESRNLQRTKRYEGRTREAGIVAFAFEQPSQEKD
jgi:hypothetical protein